MNQVFIPLFSITYTETNIKSLNLAHNTIQVLELTYNSDQIPDS